MTTLQEDLWKTLDNLTGEQFKLFKWLLKNERNNGLPVIPVSRLDPADRQDTVDLMVQKYGEVHALSKSVQILAKMDRNDLAQHLSNTSSARGAQSEKSLNSAHAKCESEKQKSRLREVKGEIRLKIKERQMKISEIQRSAELSKKSAERQTEDSLRAFAVLNQLLEESLACLTEAIKDKQKAAQEQADDVIRALEQEISELSRREAELEHLLLTQDDLKFLQDLKSDFTFPQPSYGKAVMASVDKLKELLQKEMETFLSRAKLIRMQQFAADVTLDPDTAHPNLVLSPDWRQVHCGGVKQNLPNNPERFDTAVNVLGRQGFSSGRLYFEVQVTGKSAWDVGVVYKSIGRKGSISPSPHGGHWAICLRGGNTFKAAGLNLDVKPPISEVGVFVDYEKGSIMFCNVDSAELIHRYLDCAFTDTLYPFFSPGVSPGGMNSAPLVIRQSTGAVQEGIKHPTPTDGSQTETGGRGERRKLLADVQISLIKASDRNSDRQFPRSEGDNMETLSVKLLDILKSLKQDDFKQFKWFLKQDNILEGQKGIPEDDLEGADRCQTIDLMVRKYKDPGAKKLAIKILQEIRQNNLVDGLKRFCEQQDLNIQHLQFMTEGIGEKEAELENLREFAVDVTLDPDTAHHDLVLSSDGKQVYDTDVTKDLPMTPKRFDKCASVVGKETFSSGKFYIEVQVEGKTEWTVGVALETIDRKGSISLSPNNGFWTIWLRDKVYEALAGPSVVLPLKSRLQKVGIFVDYDKGLVSFYNINTADLIYTYNNCSFKKKLLLYCHTSTNQNGKNSAPMIITPVVHKINKAELRSIQEFAVDVTLDPDTAHPELILSDNGKRVHHVDERKDVPDKPERFSDCVNILGKQRFSHERFYFEVQVKGKTDWTLGVATESIDRKGATTLQPESGFWTIYLRNGNEYEAFDKPIIRLPIRSNPERVGVFVDYDGGLVSFYNVDTADLLYSFTGCCFAETLLPFFSPCTNAGGTNSAPLIISPVTQHD
ncbi:uncharacterized protein FYW61_021263 [Anableps anableps]